MDTARLHRSNGYDVGYMRCSGTLITNSCSLTVFKSKLKTYIFRNTMQCAHFTRKNLLLSVFMQSYYSYAKKQEKDK